MAPKIILLYALLIAGAATCTAQDTAKKTVKIPPAFWGDIGLGAGSLGGASGVFYGSAQITQQLVITGGIQGESSEGFKALDLSARQEQDLTSISLFIGQIYKRDYSMFTLSAGVSYVEYQDKTIGGFWSSTPTVIKTKYTVGVPVLMRFYIVAGQCIGFGAGIYGNFNAAQSSGGISLILGFGRIQTHPERRVKEHDPLHIFGR